MPRRPPGQAGPATAVAAEEFHRLRVKLLPPADAAFLLRALQDYATMRKPDRLVQALKPIIDTVPKRAVVEQLCESLVPPAHRSIILAAFPPPSTAASPHAPITLVVNLHRMGGSGGGLGLSLRGGSEYGLGLFVSAVVDGSPADLGGLQRGDRLVSIEGRNTEGMSHAGAVELLVAAGEVVGLEIERGGEAIPTGDRFRLASAWRHKDAEQSRAQEKRKFTRREVVLNRPPGGSQPLGMGLRGGAETGLTGIFVSAVSGGGTAAEAGIRPGDRLVAINGNVLGPDCSLNTAIAALVSAVGAVSLSIEPAAVPPRRRPAPSETRPAPSSAPSPAPSSAAASPAASPAVMPVGAVFEEIAFGGVMRRGRTARKDDSIRASTYLDDEGGAISTVRSVDSPGAESRGGGGGGVADAAYIAGREVVDVILDPTQGPVGLEVEGGCDSDEPHLGVRVVGLRENGIAFAKLQHDDELLTIGGESLLGRTHDQCIALFVAAIGSRAPFTLKVARAGAGAMLSALEDLDSLESHLTQTPSPRGALAGRPHAARRPPPSSGNDSEEEV